MEESREMPAPVVPPAMTRTACRCGWRSEWHDVDDAPNAWWFARMAARVQYFEHWDQQHGTRPAPAVEER
jgi:hypothetical protein